MIIKTTGDKILNQSLADIGGVLASAVFTNAFICDANSNAGSKFLSSTRTQVEAVRFKRIQISCGWSVPPCQASPKHASWLPLAQLCLLLPAGKGLFTKEIDDALLDKRIDIAVHSMKVRPLLSACEYEGLGHSLAAVKQ